MNKQQGKAPQIRFPEFKDAWEKKKLNEIIEINPTNTILPERFIYIDLESVTDGKLLKENEVYKNNAPSRAQRVLKRKDVLFQMVRPYQKNNLYFDREGDYVASTGYAQIRTQQIAMFIYQYLHFQKFVDKVILRCTGTSYPAINSTDLSNIEISFPTLPEQTRIASFFTVLDKKIAEIKQKKSLLELYKKGIMQKLFSQELRFKDENGKEFPKWEKKKLRDVVEFRNGKAHEQDISEDGKYIVVNSKFISMEGEVKKYSDTQICPLEVGEIVMVMSDVPNGKALAKCFYVDENDKYTLNQRICALKATAVEPKFLLYILNRNRYYLMFDSGVGQTNLTRDEVLNCPLEIPKEKKEQVKILNFISSIDAKIEVAKNQLEQTQRFKMGLLQNMFI